MRALSLSGLKFGRLTAIRRTAEGGRSKWVCKCDCGNEVTVFTSNLTRNHTTSCGCVLAELQENGGPNKSHGLSRSREHRTWSHIKARCYNPNVDRFPEYGGRGITVCDRWINSFENFYSDMGICPPGGSIERKDVNGNYEPSNCIWIELPKQQRNKTSNVHLIAFGVSKLQTDWAKLLNTSDSHIRQALGRGRSIEWLANRRGLFSIIQTQCHQEKVLAESAGS